MKSRIFVSWVGLRGAVPIIFATYPVVAGVEGSNIIFNIVFFITIVSLVVQGTTISFVARMLNLSKPLEKTGNDFGVELPEEIDSDLSDMTITTEMLEEADTLKDMNLPKGTLVMIVKRGDEFLIPNGTLKLHKKEINCFSFVSEKKDQKRGTVLFRTEKLKQIPLPAPDSISAYAYAPAPMPEGCAVEWVGALSVESVFSVKKGRLFEEEFLFIKIFGVPPLINRKT